MKFKIYTTILCSSFLMLWGNLAAQAPLWLWANGIGGPGSDNIISSAIDPTGSGDIYSVGSFEGTVDFDPGEETFNLTSNGIRDIFISKLDASGNLVWALATGGTGFDAGLSITLDGVGNVYITGQFKGTVDFDLGAGTFNLTAIGTGFSIFILKLDASGNFVWAKNMGGTPYGGVGTSVAVDLSGNVYTTGSFYGVVDFDPGADIFDLTANSVDLSDIFISKLDADGNFSWAKQMGGTRHDEAYAIAVDASGNVFITGGFQGTADFDPGTEIYNLIVVEGVFSNVFIAKLDVEGNFDWANQIGGPGFDNGRSIALDDSGNVYITGSFVGTIDFDPGDGEFDLASAGESDIFISKFDASGNFVWAKNMGGQGADVSYSIIIDPSGSGDIYTTGGFQGTADFDPGDGEFNLISTGDFDIFVSKLDESGNFEWSKSAGGTGNDQARAMALDASGQLYVMGFFSSPSMSFDSSSVMNADENGITLDIFIAKIDANISSPVVDIKTPQITIYPNPVTDYLTIVFEESDFLKGDITMFNILGEIVFSSPNKNYSNKKTIDISVLPSGIYFIELDIDGKKFASKVIKE